MSTQDPDTYEVEVTSTVQVKSLHWVDGDSEEEIRQKAKEEAREQIDEMREETDIGQQTATVGELAPVVGGHDPHA